MNTPDHDMRELLQRAVLPITNRELKRDLWPQMLNRLNQRPLRVSPLDWALVAMSLAGCLLFPRIILALLFHL